MNIGQSDAVTIGEYNEQGELMQGYYYSPQNSLGNAPIAIKHNDNGITQTSYHLNTPQMLTRPNGSVVWQGQYDAFGEVTQTNTQVSNPLRFPGQYQDDETGLHYNWYRYYDNSIGRYVTSDPIGLLGGMNTYGYVMANPLVYSDFRGLSAQGLACKGICSKATKQCKYQCGLRGGTTVCSFQCEAIEEECKKKCDPEDPPEPPQLPVDPDAPICESNGCCWTFPKDFFGRPKTPVRTCPDDPPACD